MQYRCSSRRTNTGLGPQYGPKLQEERQSQMVEESTFHVLGGVAREHVNCQSSFGRDMPLSAPQSRGGQRPRPSLMHVYLIYGARLARRSRSPLKSHGCIRYALPHILDWLVQYVCPVPLNVLRVTLMLAHSSCERHSHALFPSKGIT